MGGWLSWAGQVNPGKRKHGDSPLFVGGSGVGASQDSLCEATGKTQAPKRFSKERHRLGDSGRKWVASYWTWLLRATAFRKWIMTKGGSSVIKSVAQGGTLVMEHF